MPPQPGICDLPGDLLQNLCLERLILKDSVALLSTCRRLWQLGGSSIWPSIETLELDTSCPTHVPSLFRWLQRRRGTLKRLKLVTAPPRVAPAQSFFGYAIVPAAEPPTGRPLAVGIFLLGALFEGQLVSLCWDSRGQRCKGFSADGLIAAFPSLKQLAMPGTTASVTISLLQLTALTCLRLECGPLPDSLGCTAPFIPTSLRRLELSDTSVLPEAVFAATQLQAQWGQHLGSLSPACHATSLATLLIASQALALYNEGNEDWIGFEKLELRGLERLTGLTSLALRRCRLERIPPVLASLTRLAALDLALNGLGEDVEDKASVLAPLSALSALEELHLEGALRMAVDSLPVSSTRLKVFNYLKNGGYNGGALPLAASACAGLQVLGCQVSVAAASMPLLAGLTQLEAIYLAIRPGEVAYSSEVSAPLLAVLRALPQLRLVVLERELAEVLGGYKVPSSSGYLFYPTQAQAAQQLHLREAAAMRALSAWQELLPGKEVVVRDFWPERLAPLPTIPSLRPPPRWDEVE